MQSRIRVGWITLVSAVVLLALRDACGQDIRRGDVTNPEISDRLAVGIGLGADDPISLDAWFTTASNTRPARLFVKAQLAKGWYVASLQQKPPYLPTKIRLDRSKQFQLLEDFMPAAPPKIVRDGEDVQEKHIGQVLWSAPIRLAASLSPSTLW